MRKKQKKAKAVSKNPVAKKPGQKKRGRPPGSTKAKRRAKAKRLPKAVKSVKSVKAVKSTKPTGFDLPRALKAKIKAAGLSVSAAAKKMGVTDLSVRNTLSGKSSPNARTVKRYAAFVGVAVKQLVGEKPTKPKARRGRPPGSGKKRGRPPGKGKGRRGRPPGSGKKRGRPPGKGKGRRGRPPGRPKAITIKAGRFPKGEMTKIAKARKVVDEIITDRLAIRVHNMSAGERAKLEKMLR
jgi:ribosome-binding protein aMBF1 (putative translation factor)